MNVAQTKKKAVAIQPAPVQDQSQHPGQLIKLAIEQGADIERLERLMDLQERFNRDQALKAFNSAMAEFKKNPPVILKNAHVHYKKKDGSITEYDHTTLDNICKAIDEALSAVGIAYRWRTGQAENGDVQVTCILTHSLGHQEETMLFSAPDDSGGKNKIQAIGSAVTYLQRYTLLSATGCAVGGMDNDAAPAPEKTISKQLVKNLKQLIKDVGADEKLFLDWLETMFKTRQLNGLTSDQFDSAIAMLNAKKKSTTKKKETA